MYYVIDFMPYILISTFCWLIVGFFSSFSFIHLRYSHCVPGHGDTTINEADKVHALKEHMVIWGER